MPKGEIGGSTHSWTNADNSNNLVVARLNFVTDPDASIPERQPTHAASQKLTGLVLKLSEKKK